MTDMKNNDLYLGWGTFLEGIKGLKDKTYRCIMGPEGGILIIDKYGNIKYQCASDNKIGIVFSPENFLGHRNFYGKKPVLKRYVLFVDSKNELNGEIWYGEDCLYTALREAIQNGAKKISIKVGR
jgi:hypothetical protein